MSKKKKVQFDKIPNQFEAKTLIPHFANESLISVVFVDLPDVL